ncbi:ferredoxin-NADP reductase [Streptomyces sp. B4I13]|nr:ferredoxin-NADP reductase [Streptomyces sp. B4I13]
MTCPMPPSHLWYEREAPAGARTGLTDLTDVPVAPGTRAYLCARSPFMRAVRAQLIAKGVAPAGVHYEVIGPDLWPATAS